MGVEEEGIRGKGKSGSEAPGCLMAQDTRQQAERLTGSVWFLSLGLPAPAEL